jgi:hypothetical protein
MSISKLFHPNIHGPDGRMAAGFLENWEEDHTMNYLIGKLQILIAKPDLKFTVNKQASDLYKANFDGYSYVNKKLTEFTIKEYKNRSLNKKEDHLLYKLNQDKMLLYLTELFVQKRSVLAYEYCV